MPQPYTRIEIKIPDELMSQINQARVETPVATWIKEAIKQRLQALGHIAKTETWRED